MVKVIALARYLMVLWFVGGVVGAIIGIATWDGALVAGALAQMLLAAFVLGIGATGVGEVHEVRGPDGDFVVRGGKRRVWRERSGAGKALAFVRGTTDWAVVVRPRDDDPFGEPVMIELVDTEVQSVKRAAEVARLVRAGDLP